MPGGHSKRLSLWHRLARPVGSSYFYMRNRAEKVTGGAITSAGQVAKIGAFLDNEGVHLSDLQAGTVEDALKGDIPKKARRVLEIRQALGKSAVKKLQKFLDMADTDGRIRGTMLYHGASTGRWSGRGIQPQNLFRPTIKDVLDCIDTILEGDYGYFRALYPDVLNAVAS